MPIMSRGILVLRIPYIYIVRVSFRHLFSEPTNLAAAFTIFRLYLGLGASLPWKIDGGLYEDCGSSMED